MRTTIERPNGVGVRFGGLDVLGITRHDLDALRDAQLVVRVEKFKDSRGRAQTWVRGGHVSANRCLARLRAFYGWAVRGDYVAATPLKKGTESVVELFREARANVGSRRTSSTRTARSKRPAKSGGCLRRPGRTFRR